MESVKLFLEHVSQINSAIRANRQKNAQTEVPDFNLFEVINPKFSELHLSKVIAFLFDPKGKHEQKHLYLNAFLEKIGMPEWLNSDKLAQCDIKLEKRIGKNDRRIDIYIECKEGAIAIENKPWANDLYRQLSDYATHLKEKYGENGNWLLIYFCNQKPEQRSITEQEKEDYKSKKQFVEVKFTELNEILEECIHLTQAEPIKIFIQGLIKYIRKKINREPYMPIKEATAKSIISNEHSIAAAFDISQSLELAKSNLLDILKKQLNDIIKNEHPNWVLEWNITNKFEQYQGFGIILSSEHDLHIRFEFRRNGKDFKWGIKCHNEEYNKTKNEKVWSHLNEIFNQYYQYYDTQCTPAWPWLIDKFFIDSDDEKLNHIFNGSIRHWDNNIKLWQLIIRDFSFAKQFILIAKDVEDKIQQKPELCFSIRNSVDID